MLIITKLSYKEGVRTPQALAHRVLRFLEETTPIPENVLAARAEARGKVLT
ncbi:hypothetical protein [Pseudomonas khavaziana]|uniref:hypothetical protein n=1 Tax=Pseudomonas khavaziana TaxID=2842351 RepID=UPI001C3D010B|nr:hypothetical protein [Pseudomonas khavaziana]MBV4478662.1 hypothetical protein [Pseudomonas khavaziana]